MDAGFLQWVEEQTEDCRYCGHDRASHIRMNETIPKNCHVVVQPNGPIFFCSCVLYAAKLSAC
jgi:hypothetical protein